MLDISMCLLLSGETCTKKEQCYRFITKQPDKIQSYSAFAKDCKTHNYRNFWLMTDKKENRNDYISCPHYSERSNNYNTSFIIQTF